MEKLGPRLPAGVDVAAVNGPEMTVVAGTSPIVKGFADQLTVDGIACRMLHTSHAFHSSMMDSIIEPFLRTVETIHLSEPLIPFLSTVTGDWTRPGELTNPNYWARHLRSTVQFSKAVQVLLSEEGQTLFECGPRRTCASLALQHRPKKPDRVISAMPDSAEPDDEYASILLGLGALWLNGCTVDWSAFHEREVRRRVALPSYPFQRKRYWIEPGTRATTAALGAGASTSTPIGFSNVASLDATDSTFSGTPTDPSVDRFTGTVRSLIEELLGSKMESFDADARFIMLGLESLMLTQLARTLRVRYGLEVTFRDLVERLATPRLLADELRARSIPVSDPAVEDGSRARAVERELPLPILTPRSERNPQTDGLAPSANQEDAVHFARLGRDEHGRLAWYVTDLNRPGKFLKVSSHG